MGLYWHSSETGRSGHYGHANALWTLLVLRVDVLVMLRDFLCTPRQNRTFRFFLWEQPTGHRISSSDQGREEVKGHLI
ncbi:hypothetical protein D3C80_1551640 [compost metagenome]